ncbi:MAG: ABC transporter permease [Candidatus Rickettsia vulgarisii]
MIKRKVNPFKFFINNFNLIYSSTLDELRKKNAGSILGSIWLILFPILLLSVYAVIYIAIFNLRIPEFSQFDYILYIFAGLVPFLAISESLSTTTMSLVGSKSLLKNTIFPIEVLPITAVFKSHVGFIFGILLIILMSIYAHHLSFSYLLLPIVFILQLMFLVGLGWCLGLITIFLRDTQNFIALFNMVLMVSSPIAYTPNMVPEKISILINWNPFAKYIISYQYILVYGKLPPLDVLISMIIISFITFYMGYRLFYKLKNTVVNYV